MRSVPQRESINPEPVTPASKSLGYRNHRAFEAKSKRSTDALFSGAFSARRLPSGVLFWRSDLTALSNHEQHAVVDRSLMIRLLLSPSPTELELDGKRRIVRPREIFAYRATEALSGISRSYEGERYKCLGLHIQPDKLSDSDLAERVESFMNESGDASISVTPSIAALAGELFDDRYADDLDTLLCESWALNVVARCLDPEAISTPRRNVNASQIQSLFRAREFINSHASRKLSIRIIAKEAGMSATTFKDAYRNYFNETPFETIRAVRMDRAFAGLSTGRWTVSEAARQSGYAHLSSFSDAYLQRFGRRPSDRA